MNNNITEEFERIKRLPPYVFSEVNSIKASARHNGKDIIDLGMGNPDSPTPEHIVEKLRETVLDPRSHRYSVSQGISGLRKAQADYYKRRFNVDIDPENEIVVTLGSKEGLANLSNAISVPGDTILVPTPSYPIHHYGFILSGASVQAIPNSIEDTNFIEQIKDYIERNSTRPKAVLVNYPCNPTAETVTVDFYQELVDLCKHYGVYIISDLAYCEIYFDNPPPSVLEAKGGKDIAIELTSVSKTYAMAGWRVGFAVGNPTLIHALKRIKSYLDYGAFTPIQVAATAALNGPQECVEGFRNLYRDRRDVLIDGLHDAGWNVPTPDASMFAWAKIPEKYADMKSLEFSKLLMNKAHVAVAPGIGFGKYGDDYVRIALVENKQRIRQAVRNIKQFLNKK